jgi:hypothetical protein
MGVYNNSDDNKRGSIVFADTWRFDGKYWAYWHGPQTINENPVYGSYKNFSEDHHPGSRAMHGVAQTDDGVYIIGGHFPPNSSFSDIWKFDPYKGWALWAGEVARVPPRPGTKRVPHSNNLFGQRIAATAVIDDEENIWIYGGAEEINYPPGMISPKFANNRSL